MKRRLAFAALAKRGSTPPRVSASAPQEQPTTAPARPIKGRAGQNLDDYLLASYRALTAPQCTTFHQASM
jgi:hypothetical protein